MGPADTKTPLVPLGAFLAETYQDLSLITEQVGVSLWFGIQNQQKRAIRCFPEWSLATEEVERLQARFHAVVEADLSSISHPIEFTRVCDHVVITEEWVEGETWSQAVLSRDTALEYAVEAFDLVHELHQAQLLHGNLSQESFLIDHGTGSLKLLGLLSGLPEESVTPEEDLKDTLRLLQEHVTDEEQASLNELKSGRELSRKLSHMLTTIQPERSEPDLIGRDRFLEELSRAQQQGGLISVEAPAGGGKSRLLREWTKNLQARVLQGKAAKEVAPSPFQLFQNPFSQLENEIAQDSGLWDKLQRQADATLPLEASLSNENREQRSALVWLARLLRILHEHRPTVLLLEDVHWADDLTQSFIEFWSRNPGEALIVVSFRPDDLKPSHPLLHLKYPRLCLPPLSNSQATRLLQTLQPSAGKVLLESVVKRAHGNPFLLQQFLRSGTLKGDFDEVRVRGLDDNTRECLAVAAVLGDKVSRPLLSHCLGREPALTQGVDQEILTFENDVYRFTHDRFRELSLSFLKNSQMAKVHSAAAEYHVGQEPQDPFRIAYHYQLSGQPEAGKEFALQAAETARIRHDLSTAVYYYQAALSGLSKDKLTPESYLIHFRLGDCYRLSGRYAASEDCFLSALKACREPIQQARIKQALGDVYFKQADLEKARDALQQGLSLLGESQPFSIPLSFLFQAGRLAWFSFITSKRNTKSEELDLTKAALYNRLAYVGWFLEGPITSIWAHLCEINLAERYGPSADLARAQANHAMAMSAVPVWSRALNFGERAVQTAKQVEDNWSLGQVGHFYGAALLGSGQLQQARSVLLDAQRVLEQTGDRWEENGVCYHLALVYYRLGALEKAAELATKTQRIGVEINDRLAAGDNLFTMARARRGRLDRSLIETEKTYSIPDLQRACEILGAEGLLDLREGQYESAVSRFTEAVEMYRSKRVQNIYAAPLYCWLATAERLLAQQAVAPRRDTLLKQALKTAHMALRQARKYRVNLPHALREAALLTLLTGNSEKARRHLLESMDRAKELEMQDEYRASHSVYHRFRWLLGPADLDTPVEYDEYLWLLGEEGRETASLKEMERLLKAATKISHCLSVATALHQLCQGCKQLLGDNIRCAVLRRSDTEFSFLAGDTELSTISNPRTEAWSTFSLPLLQKQATLVVSAVDQSKHSLIDFLVTVTIAVVDRAGRTESSAILSQDLQHSTTLLGQEAGRLVQAHEQLLLSERLALTGRLATGLVHDLHNLMMAISGGAEVLLLDLEPNDGRRADIADILAAGRKSKQLLNHLGSLTRGETHGPRRVLLEQRISETRPLLRSLCGPLVELEFELSETPPVHFDPIAMDRVLLNLVMNARDAVSAGGTICVTTKSLRVAGHPGFPCDVPKGEYCVISVSDDGSGIPDEILPRIFELHFTTKGKMGTGVGLVTVLEIIRSSEGFLTVDTGPEGTTFQIYLPVGSSSNPRLTAAATA